MREDDIGNILLTKDAQRGCADYPILILQAHKVTAEGICTLKKVVVFRISNIHGGVAANVIPSNAECSYIVPGGTED